MHANGLIFFLLIQLLCSLSPKKFTSKILSFTNFLRPYSHLPVSALIDCLVLKKILIMKKLLFILATLFTLSGYSQSCNQSGLTPMHIFTNGMTGTNSYTEATQTFYLCNSSTIYDTLANNVSGYCRFGIVMPNAKYVVRSKGCGTIYALNNSTIVIAAGSTVACSICYEPGATIINQSTLTLGTSTCAAIITPSNVNCGLSTDIAQLKEKSNALSIYPNPSSFLVFVENNAGVFNEAEITITNLLGAVVYTTSYTGKKIKLELNELNNGVYYLSVNSAEIKEARKIVIAK